MKNEILEKLIGKNIQKYEYRKVGEDEENPDKSSGMRDTERLILTFLDGTELQSDTLCSGVSENTTMYFKLNDKRES